MSFTFSQFFSDSSVVVKGTTPYPHTLTEKLLSELLASFGSRLSSPIAPRDGQRLDVTPVLARRSWEGGTFRGELHYYRLAHPDVIRAAELLAVRPQSVEMVIAAITDPAKFVEHVHLENDQLAVDIHLHLGVLIEVRVGVKMGGVQRNAVYDMLEKAAQLKQVQGFSCDSETNILPKLKRLSEKPLDQPADAERFLRESFGFLFPPDGDKVERQHEGRGLVAPIL